MSSEKDDVKSPEEALEKEALIDPTDDPGADPELYDTGTTVVPEEAADDADGENQAGGGGGDDGTPDGDAASEVPEPQPPEDEDEEELEEEDGDGAHMSLLDHLGELRIRLTRSFIAVAIGMVACYSFAEQMFNILMEPMVKVFQQQAAHNPMLTPAFYEDLGRTLSALLVEKGFQHTDQLPLFMEGLQKSLMQLSQEGHFQYTYPAEAFFSHILISVVAGLFLVSPYVFAQIWGFIAPGLYEHERKWMIPMAVISAIFFTSGALFGYFVVFPFGFEFFASFSTEGIQFTPKLNEYLSFCLKLLFAFGFVFELPLFIFFLARLGMVSSTTLRKKRKYAILVAFIASAILTPPDPFTQCLMAGPLIILYEAGVWVAYFFGKKEKRHLKKQAEAEAKAKAKLEAELDEVAGQAGKSGEATDEV